MQASKVPRSIDINEAAEFLGFKGTYNLREKAAAGQIPGAFKISRRWMFLMDDLIDFARNFRKKLPMSSSEIVTKRNEEWLSAKRKEAPTITHDSRSAASECKNLLDALASERPKNMKKNVDAI